MSRHTASSALAMGALILGLTNAAVAQQACVPVSGKIVNNFVFVAPDLPPGTLGVVSMVYGTKKEKLKCALSGVSAGPNPPGIDINFIHSISCDDEYPVSVPGFDGNVHSSIVLHTMGNIFPPNDPATQVNTFKEVSNLLPGAPTRGRFFGATGGQIQVEGIVYKSPVEGVPGSIDMKFSGEVCYGTAG